MNPRTLGVILAFLIATASAGCSGEPAEEKKSTPAPTSPAVAAPVKTELTREAAARQYMAIAGPSNGVYKRCAPLWKQLYETAEVLLLDGAKKCHHEYAQSLVQVSKGLESVIWPKEAQADVANLVQFTDALAFAHERASVVSSVQEYVDQQFPEDPLYADTVRARFGLEARPKSL